MSPSRAHVPWTGATRRCGGCRGSERGERRQLRAAQPSRRCRSGSASGDRAWGTPASSAWAVPSRLRVRARATERDARGHPSSGRRVGARHHQLAAVDVDVLPAQAPELALPETTQQRDREDAPRLSGERFGGEEPLQLRGAQPIPAFLSTAIFGKRMSRAGFVSMWPA